MSKVMRFIIVLMLTGALGLGSFAASAGVYDQYKLTFSTPRWHTVYNNFLDAVGTQVSAIGAILANWVGTVDSLTLIQTTPTYSDNHTFTLAGDYSAVLPPGKRLVVDCGADGLMPNTVVSCTYGAPNSTVVVNVSNLTANLAAVSYYATRSGVNTYGSGDIVASEFGSPSWTNLQAAIALANAAGRRLLLTPGAWPVTDNIAITAPVNPVPGATFAIPTTKTLTVSASFEAGLYQVFSCTGTGKAVLTDGSAKEVYPEWWGISTSAATMAAFQAAVNTGLRVMVTGAYTLDNSASALMLNDTTNNYASIEGAHGWSASTLQFTSDANPGIQYGFTSGLPVISIKNLALYGPGGTTAGNFGFYFPSGSYNAARIIIDNVFVRLWGDDGIRLDGPAGPISVKNSQFMDCKYGIKVGTPQDVTIRDCGVHACLGGISIDSGGADPVTGISVYDTDIELADAIYPALYLKHSFGNIFHGLTLAITPDSLTTGVALVHLDSSDCIGNTFSNLMTNGAGGLSNFFIQGQNNTIIGGYHYGKLDGTGAGYFVQDHGTKTTVINPYVNASTYAAGKDIVYADLAARTGVYVGVKTDGSLRPGVLETAGEINNGMSQWLANNAVNGETHWLNNVYYSSGWKYFLADQASKITQHNGVITLSTAAAGAASGDAVSWSDRLIINNDGKFTLPGGLTTYADNAAALAGGLTAGDLYRTAAGVVLIVYTP